MGEATEAFTTARLARIYVQRDLGKFDRLYVSGNAMKGFSESLFS